MNLKRRRGFRLGVVHMKKDAFPAIRHKELLSNGESETLHSSLCLWACSTLWPSHCHLTFIFTRFSCCFFCLLGGDFSANLQLLSGSNCRHSSTSAGATFLKGENKKYLILFTSVIWLHTFQNKHMFLSNELWLCFNHNFCRNVSLSNFKSK